jgi:hypothetical protein
MNFKLFLSSRVLYERPNASEAGSFPPSGEWEELVSATEPANNKELLELFDWTVTLL